MTKRLLILSFCFCLFILPAFASDISLDDPSFSNPNEREDNVSYVNSVSFGRGWGSGEEARPSSHAHSDTDSLLPYNALEQTISSQAQPALVFGGEELPLSLEDGSLFTAGLGLWDGNGYEAGGMINALCLTSQNPDARWIIPGSVLRKLSGSGISHLVLHTGQTQAVLPTASVLTALNTTCGAGPVAPTAPSCTSCLFPKARWK